MTKASRNDAPMGLARFRAILDAFGAEPLRWPAAERASAEALLTDSAEARRLQEAAAALDDLLAQSEAPRPSPQLRAAILHAAPSRQVVQRGPIRRLWGAAVSVLAGELGGPRPAGALLGVALLLGIVAGGALGTNPDADAGAEIDIVQLALLDEQFPDY